MAVIRERLAASLRRGLGDMLKGRRNGPRWPSRCGPHGPPRRTAGWGRCRKGRHRVGRMPHAPVMATSWRAPLASGPARGAWPVWRLRLLWRRLPQALPPTVRGLRSHPRSLGLGLVSRAPWRPGSSGFLGFLACRSFLVLVCPCRSGGLAGLGSLGYTCLGSFPGPVGPLAGCYKPDN